jgi:hypothetical protein
VVRYQYTIRGDVLHLDIKKLGRFRKPDHRLTGDREQSCDGTGWEFVRAVIDDASALTLVACIPMSEP